MAMRFSERMGLREPKAVQLNATDMDLRVCLWNALQDFLISLTFWNDTVGCASLRSVIWTRFFKLPADDLPNDPGDFAYCDRFWKTVKDWYFGGKRAWHDCYDFLEFVAVHASHDKQSGKEFAKQLNNALETENAGYRFVNGEFAPITDEQELATVSAAVNAPTTALKPVSMHIQQALMLLSDKVENGKPSTILCYCGFLWPFPAAVFSDRLHPRESHRKTCLPCNWLRKKGQDRGWTGRSPLPTLSSPAAFATPLPCLACSSPHTSSPGRGRLPAFGVGPQLGSCLSDSSCLGSLPPETSQPLYFV
jgi:hypothetical protein